MWGSAFEVVTSHCPRRGCKGCQITQAGTTCRHMSRRSCIKASKLRSSLKSKFSKVSSQCKLGACAGVQGVRRRVYVRSADSRSVATRSGGNVIVRPRCQSDPFITCPWARRASVQGDSGTFSISTNPPRHVLQPPLMSSSLGSSSKGELVGIDDAKFYILR